MGLVMESKKVDNLGLQESVVQKLHSVSIHTLKDLLSKPEIELMKILNVSYPKAHFIVCTALENAVPFKLTTVLDLYKKENLRENINSDSNSDLFGKIVNDAGILKYGMICEVCGPPGCGKTQLSMQLCSEAFFTNPNSAKPISIIYIDTENNLSAHRLVEIARNKFYNKTEDEIMDMTKHVLVYHAFSVKDLEKILKSAEYEIILKNARLVIIDSIAALVRREFHDKDNKTSIERAKFLATLSAKLKDIAYYLEVSVFITNQITVSYNLTALTSEMDTLTCKDAEENIENNVEGENTKINFDNAKIIPALGYTWSHFVNIRITLQFVDDFEREFIITKSPFTPNFIYRYKVEENGLEFTDYKRQYDGEDLNMQNIKSRPFQEFNYDLAD